VADATICFGLRALRTTAPGYGVAVGNGERAGGLHADTGHAASDDHAAAAEIDGPAMTPAAIDRASAC
jgi:hypothetical protein